VATICDVIDVILEDMNDIVQENVFDELYMAGLPVGNLYRLKGNTRLQFHTRSTPP
jgi:hypothetical protein